MCECKVVRKFAGVRTEESVHSLCPMDKANDFAPIIMWLVDCVLLDPVWPLHSHCFQIWIQISQVISSIEMWTQFYVLECIVYILVLPSREIVAELWCTIRMTFEYCVQKLYLELYIFWMIWHSYIFCKYKITQMIWWENGFFGKFCMKNWK